MGRVPSKTHKGVFVEVHSYVTWIYIFEVPKRTGPETDGRKLENVWDFGRISLMPRMFISSYKYSWIAGLA